MTKLVADLAGRKEVAHEMIAGLNLTQDAYNRIIADITALNNWDDDMESNDIVRGAETLFSSVLISFNGNARDSFPLSDELFYKLFVIWAMQINARPTASLPRSFLARGNGHLCSHDTIIEFTLMVWGHPVRIEWLDNFFQQFVDDPPSPNRRRRQFAHVTGANLLRLLQRRLTPILSQPAEDTPPSRTLGKRKQNSQIAFGESTKAASSPPAQPNKKIKTNNPEAVNQLTITSDTTSRGTDDERSLRTTS